MVKPGWLAWKPLLVLPYCAVFWVSLRNVAVCPSSSASPQREWLPPDPDMSLSCWEVDSGKAVWEREGKCPASVSLPLEMWMLPAQLTGSSVLDIMASALSCLLWEPFLEIPVPIPIHFFLVIQYRVIVPTSWADLAHFSLNHHVAFPKQLAGMREWAQLVTLNLSCPLWHHQPHMAIELEMRPGWNGGVLCQVHRISQP